MESKNLTINESRILRELIKNSRQNISEISRNLNLSRNTVALIIKKLENSVIENYTVNIKQNTESNYIIAIVKSLDGIKKELLTEYFELTNGKYMVISSDSNFLNNLNYDEIHIARHRERGSENFNIDLYCDFCGGKIVSIPKTYEINRKKYYFCCDTCKSTFIKRQNALEKY
ncbi:MULTISPECIES: TRASH domain-containing protein [Acidiplasma]|jgi:DNA-binding Lrp family transcriptional regulator|uniref:TRASH domain-containing protein n=1 Tax=Acidiplasma TaxID=507753 RepID=UPI0005E6B644|nr:MULTISPECIES: TRASH domain-containing protein [unclassified Acidiplasma]KJE49924.1 hypothetical protein TZ01_02305 [Acidiplasma sp. MBA-1]WMT55112.1 MAG: TRASH domain-containing protein [Acidiplasma sp.]